MHTYELKYWITGRGYITHIQQAPTAADAITMSQINFVCATKDRSEPVGIRVIEPQEKPLIPPRHHSNKPDLGEYCIFGPIPVPEEGVS